MVEFRPQGDHKYKMKTWKGEMIKKQVKKKGRVQHLPDS